MVNMVKNQNIRSNKHTVPCTRHDGLYKLDRAIPYCRTANVIVIVGYRQ